MSKKVNIRKKANKNPELFDMVEVCNYFGFSETTTRRRIRESREGRGNFPLPLFKSGSKVLWRKIDIESWAGEEAGSTTFTPSMIPTTSSIPTKSDAQVRRELETLGVKY